MNTLESILCYGGIVFLILGLIIAIIDIMVDFFSEKLGVLCIFFIGCGIVAFGIGNSMYNANTLETEDAEIIITIEDKKTTSHRVGKYGISHDYFFYFNKCEKIEVDCGTYKKYNINDELVIKKTYWYRIDRETGERTLEKVTYNE